MEYIICDRNLLGKRFMNITIPSATELFKIVLT